MSINLFIFTYNKLEIEMDWKKMGFKTEKEYLDFLEEKWQSLKKKLEEPKIKAVFKRLVNR